MDSTKKGHEQSKKRLSRMLTLKAKMKKIEPKLQDVIDYLKVHPNLLRFEKNPYTAERLMMLLDNEKLAALEDEFNEHPNGIEIANFIWLMKCAIVHPVEEKYELVTGLIKLFQDIDINGDKHMEWSEFTQYIIDAVIGEKDARFFDARFERERELTENEIIDKAYSRKTKRYVQSKFFDNSTHSNLIKKVVYSHHNDILFSLEQSSNTLKFYSSDCQEKILNKKKIGLTVPTDYNKVAFIIDFALAEPLNTIAVVTSKKQVIFWEANFSQKLIKSSKLDVLQTGIWYLSLHKIWVTAGDDFNIKTWVFTPSMSNGDNKRFKLNHDKMLKAHKKKIMDIVELTAPRLVASASLDGKIKLWDLTDNEPRLLTELKDPQNCERGIRQLTYSHQYGSNLLSVGFEQHINIWCPEISITRAFIGRLEGHSSLVVLCKFIPLSPNVISIDDKCNIRIWDIRGMATIQVISTDGGYSLVTDVCFVTGKYDRFILAGKRLTYFENAEVQKNAKSSNDEIYPLNIDFNLYFNQLVVLTKIDMRLYDAMTGKLKKVFNEIHDDKYSVELSMFCFGARQRKFFLADNGGMIRQYNMKNGEFLKKVNDFKEIEDSEFSKKQSHIKKKETNEVSALIYINEEKLLIASYWDSTIRIYDESESEESVLLKVLSGAHKDSEIITLSYSAKQSLFASGSANGIIALWDFETGKLEGILKADELEVTQIEFLDPYPAIATTTSNGAVYLWGSRLAPARYKYKTLIKIINTLWVDGVETITPVNSILCETSLLEGYPREIPKDGFQPNDPMSFNPIIQKSAPSEKASKGKKGVGNNPQNTTTNMNGQNLDDSFTNAINKSSAHPQEILQTQQLLQVPPIQHLLKDEVILSPIKNKDGATDQPLQQQLVNSPKGGSDDVKESAETFVKYWNTYDQNLKSNKTTYCYLYVGDAKGLLQIWNLTDILHSRQIFQVVEEKKKQSFQLRRKDLINATKAADNMLSGQERRNNKNLLVIHSVNSVLLKRWVAHSGIINKLTRIQEPPSVFSCSHDKTIKIWNLKGEFYSKINLIAYDKPNQWNFPYDWVNQKLKDLDQVFDQLKVIENEQLQPDPKEKVRMRYLTSKYYGENDHDGMQKMILEQDAPQVKEEKNRHEEEDEYIGIKIKYDVKPQPSLQDEFQQILLKFQQEKEEEENRLKRLALQEKEQNLVDMESIKKYYNIDKVPNAIPTQEENIFLSSQIQGFVTKFSQIKQPKQQPTKSSQMSYQQNQIQNSGVSLPQIQNSEIFNKTPMKQSGEAFKMRRSAQSSSTLSTTKRKVFSLSTNNFLRNNAFVTSITKHLQPKNNEEDKYKPQIDVKYKLGEVHRCYRVAQYKYVNSVASNSPQILFADNDLLQQKMRGLKQLHAKKNMDDDDEYQDMEDSDGEKTEEGTVRNSTAGKKQDVSEKANKASVNADDTQSMGQSVGFSSFMSKQKSAGYHKQ